MPKRSKILIVDDMEINRTLLAEVFYEEFEIIEAENGKVALDMISRYYDSISAVFLDVVMPVMDGITVLKELNSTNLINKFPIILITSDDSPETQKKCYELSVSDIVYKPYVPLIVKTRVHNLIELYDYKNKFEDNVQTQKKKMEEIIETQARNFNELLKIQQDEIRARARLFREYNNIIVKILSTVIEFRNLESFSHIHKIQHFTNIILLTLIKNFKQYKFTKDDVDRITVASAIHDIGKVDISSDVILKPSKLTDEEFALIKSHTIKGCEIWQTGYDFITDKKFYQYGYDICRYHHERWDGSGYPDGISGDDIPIWAHIVGLADVYEALTSKRSYKAPYTHDDAIAMLLSGKAGSFSPVLLECLEMASKELAEIEFDSDNIEDAKFM